MLDRSVVRGPGVVDGNPISVRCSCRLMVSYFGALD